jgi:hypothetical protein
MPKVIDKYPNEEFPEAVGMVIFFEKKKINF